MLGSLSLNLPTKPWQNRRRTTWSASKTVYEVSRLTLPIQLGGQWHHEAGDLSYPQPPVEYVA
jgi:hypothetical protein